MKTNKMILVDPKGVEQEVEIVTNFVKNGVNYILYSRNEDIGEDSEKVYLAKEVELNGEKEIQEVEDINEFNETIQSIKEILKKESEKNGL